MTRRQVHILINIFNNLSDNKIFQMAAPVNYLLRLFEGNINTGYPKGLKIDLQAAKDIYKESKKLDI